MPSKNESNILNGLTEDQRIALHFQHLDTVEEQKRELAEANSRYRNARKAAKADLGEEGLAEIDEAMRQSTPEGEADARADLDRMIRVARWHGASIGQQMSMLDALPPRNFEAEGKLAGLRGLAAKPPEGLAQADMQTWLTGYYQGQAVLAEGFGRGVAGEAEQKEKVAAATKEAEGQVKRKRGRPRKNPLPEPQGAAPSEARAEAASDDQRDFRPPYARPENQQHPKDPNGDYLAGVGDERGPAIGTEPATTRLN